RDRPLVVSDRVHAAGLDGRRGRCPPSLAQAALLRRAHRGPRLAHPDLRRAHAAPHGPDRHRRRQRQGAHWRAHVEHAAGTYLDDLAAVGVTPEQVDFVVCTHLHVDHVGWNTRWRDGRWIPTFPNARYIIAGAEYEFWKYESDAGKEESGCIADSV